MRYLSFIVILGIFSSCQGNKSKALEAYIPADAFAVAAVEPVNLITKFLLDQPGKLNLKDIPFLPIANQQEGDNARFYDAINQSGISLVSRFYLSFEQVSDLFIINLFIKIGDAKTLKTYFENMKASQGLKISEENGVYLAQLPGNRVAFAWNQNVLIARVYPFEMEPFNMQKDMLGFFELTPEQSMQADQEFSLFQKESFDLAVFLPTRNMNYHKKRYKGSFAYLKENFEDQALYFSFGKGNLKLRLKSKIAPSQSEKFDRILTRAQQTRLLPKLKGDDLIGYVNLRYDKELVPLLIKELKFKLAMQMFLIASEVEENHFYELFQEGVFLAQTTGVPVTRQTDEDQNSKAQENLHDTIPGLILQMETNNRMDYLLKTFQRKNYIQENKDERSAVFSFNASDLIGFTSFFEYDPEFRSLLFFSGDKEHVFIRHRAESHQPRLTAAPPSKELLDRYFRYPASGYLDFKKLGMTLPEEKQKDYLGIDIREMVNVIDHGWFAIEEPENGFFSAYAELSFTDQSRSGLTEFLKLLRGFSLTDLYTKSDFLGT